MQIDLLLLTDFSSKYVCISMIEANSGYTLTAGFFKAKIGSDLIQATHGYNVSISIILENFQFMHLQT